MRWWRRFPANVRQENDDLRLSEDFHLDSLGRVQLAAALEERLTDAPGEGVVETAKTLGDLRQIVSGVRSSEVRDTESI